MTFSLNHRSRVLKVEAMLRGWITRWRLRTGRDPWNGNLLVDEEANRVRKIVNHLRTHFEKLKQPAERLPQDHIKLALCYVSENFDAGQFSISLRHAHFPESREHFFKKASRSSSASGELFNSEAGNSA